MSAAEVEAEATAAANAVRGRVRALQRYRSQDDPQLIIARRELKAANLARDVVRAITAEPHLTMSERRRVAAILRGGGDV